MLWVEYMSGAINNIYLMLEGNKSDLKSFSHGNRTYPSSYIPE